MAKTSSKSKTRQLPADLNAWDSDYPSKITDDYWVAAGVKVHIDHPKIFKEPKKTFNSIEELKKSLRESKTGKWLIFVDISELDETWQKIKKFTEQGILGDGAKAATAKPNPNASSPNEKVICVYTYNWLDTDDVFRVEQALRAIGIEQTIYYKADSDTGGGQYKNRGDSNISKYVSKGVKNYKKHPLHSLNGVGFAKGKILNKIGIKTFDDLLSFDTSKELNKVGATVEYINKLKLYALSQVENKIYRLAPYQFPKENLLYFDIETDINTPHDLRRVWSIAVHHNKKIIHFYAETWSKEKNILKQFITYLKSNTSAFLFSYSSFDVSVLKHALSRHNLDVDFFLNCKHIDLCLILKQNYILPVDSYSVKDVGAYFGFKYKNENYDGLTAASEYMFNQRYNKKLSKDLLNYIKDDVKVMDHIINRIQTRKDIKDIFDYE